MDQNLLIWLHEVDPTDPNNLSENILQLAKLARAGLPVVPGFIITSNVFEHFLDGSNLRSRWQAHLDEINYSDPISIQQGSQQLQNLLASAPWPGDLQLHILNHYSQLVSPAKKKGWLGFRSSAPIQIRLGSRDPFTGESNLFSHIKSFWSDFFTPELLMSKTNIPKNVLVRVHLPLANLAPHHDGLASLQKAVNDELYFTHELEVALHNNQLAVMTVRPTTHTVAPRLPKETVVTPVVFQGIPASPGLRSGSVKKITIHTDPQTIDKGDVVVAQKLEKHQLSLIKKAAALILAEESNHSAAVLEAKKQGVPTVAGALAAISTLENRDNVIVDGTKGEITFGSLMTAREEIKPYSQPSWDTEETSKVTTATKLWQHLFTGEEPHSDSDGYVIRSNSLLSTDFGQMLYPKKVLVQVSTEKKVEETVLALRNKLKMKHVSLLLSAVGSSYELEQLKTHWASKGLNRTNSLHYWLLVQTPAQLLELNALLEVGVDGVYIDASQLASLTSGKEGAEIDQATLKLITMGLEQLKNHKVPVMVELNDLAAIDELVQLGVHNLVVRGKILPGARIDIAEAERQLILRRS